MWRMGNGVEGHAEERPHWMPCPLCNQAEIPKWRVLMRASVIAAATMVAACTAKPELPPLPPTADGCALYSSYNYSPAAAAVESLDAITKHHSNEAWFYQHCVADHPALDPKRSGGPR
jgi:hypothetical protein